MTRRLLVAAAAAAITWVASTAPAQAAVSQVKVGNFYFEDATAGDGKVEIRQGDQLRFLAVDAGPGTPHTADVDDLGIHSGSLAVGDTYTTPPIQKTGTFTLYCKLHLNRGHRTNLVVLSTTTAAPATTATTRAAATAPTTTRATATTTPAKAAPAPTTTGPAGSPGSPAPPAAAPGPPAPSANTPPGAVPGEPAPAGATSDTLAPTGRDEASADELQAAAAPDSLEVALGRKPATNAPWTRSVRMAALTLIPLIGAAAAALARYARGPDTAPPTPSSGPQDATMPTLPAPASSPTQNWHHR